MPPNWEDREVEIKQAVNSSMGNMGSITDMHAVIGMSFFIHVTLFCQAYSPGMTLSYGLGIQGMTLPVCKKQTLHKERLTLYDYGVFLCK